MGRQTRSLEDAQARLDTKWPGRLKILTYSGSRSICAFECRTCGSGFESSFTNVLSRGSCPTCRPAGGNRSTESWTGSQEAAKAGGVIHLGVEPSGNVNRTLRHKFMCHKHGVFSVGRHGGKAVCPKCRGYISPNDPDHLDPKLRSKPCDLYLIEIRDSVGLWTKVGISTSWAARKRNYAREGVTVLRETRLIRMTLYDALVIEREIKRWARNTIGRRKCPRKKWSGWSESFADKACTLPAAFDREVAKFRGGRRI
jgi:hypothetical protein